MTKTFFTMTVPDISSIPVCYQHGVVPWHLLERSHYNFFNGNSLTLLLKKAFRTVELGRIDHGQVNGRFVPGSLFAMCKNSEGVVAC